MYNQKEIEEKRRKVKRNINLIGSIVFIILIIMSCVFK